LKIQANLTIGSTFCSHGMVLQATNSNKEKE